MHEGENHASDQMSLRRSGFEAPRFRTDASSGSRMRKRINTPGYQTDPLIAQEAARSWQAQSCKMPNHSLQDSQKQLLLSMGKAVTHARRRPPPTMSRCNDDEFDVRS